VEGKDEHRPENIEAAQTLRGGWVSLSRLPLEYLLIADPLFDFIPMKTVVGANLESRNLTLADQSVDRGDMKPQILR
jgi:hypothetical protein